MEKQKNNKDKILIVTSKEKIENTKSIYVWLLFLIIYISFSTEVLFRPFVFAEDTLFLNDALVYGYKSLLFRHAGYLEIFSRIIGNISIVAGGYLIIIWFLLFV